MTVIEGAMDVGEASPLTNVDVDLSTEKWAQFLESCQTLHVRFLVFSASTLDEDNVEAAREDVRVQDHWDDQKEILAGIEKAWSEVGKIGFLGILAPVSPENVCLRFVLTTDAWEAVNPFLQYREWIDDAYAEPDRDVSIQKWRRVFGEDFAKGEVVEKAATAVALVLHETAATDMVLAVSRLGPEILKRISPRLPHVEAPPWKAARHTFPVVVRVSESHTR